MLSSWSIAALAGKAALRHRGPREMRAIADQVLGLMEGKVTPVTIGASLLALATIWLRLHYRSRDRKRLQQTAVTLADRGARDVIIRHGRRGYDELRFSHVSTISGCQSLEDSPCPPGSVIRMNSREVARGSRAGRVGSGVAARKGGRRRPTSR